jgi:hypothetical protein
MPVKVMGGWDESNSIPDPPGAPGSNRVTAGQAPGSELISPSLMAESIISVEDDHGLREQFVKILNSALGER